MVAVEGVVQPPKLLGSAVGGGPNNNSIRSESVGNRRTLFQKLRVGAHFKRQVDAPACKAVGNAPGYLIRGPDGYGGFIDDHLAGRHVGSDALRNSHHVLKISVAIG